MDYVEGRGAQYFAGYCSYCGKKHYLMPKEARSFCEILRYYFVREKFNLLKLALLPKPEVVKLESPPAKVKTINLKYFDVKYRDRGGLAWFRTHDYKLKDIAAHFGFSMEYARRVKNEI